MRTLEVIFELYCVLLERRWRFEKSAHICPARFIQTSDVRSGVNCVLRYADNFESNSPKASRRTITDYPHGLFSASYGLIFVDV